MSTKFSSDTLQVALHIAEDEIPTSIEDCLDRETFLCIAVDEVLRWMFTYGPRTLTSSEEISSFSGLMNDLATRMTEAGWDVDADILGHCSENEVSARSGFVDIPHVVWPLVRNPSDFMLWSVVKNIAGENGCCCASTEQLAALAKMSPEKVIDSCRFLIDVGLLMDEVRNDPVLHREVQELTIPAIKIRNQRATDTSRDGTA